MSKQLEKTYNPKEIESKLYDKWLEPPVWTFVEKLVKSIRALQLQS